MASLTEPERGGREIRDVALLDLSGADAASALDGVTRISNVATILVPHRLVARLSRIPMQHVATTVPIPDDRPARVMAGQITLSGEALADTGAEANDVLVIVGSLILTSPLTRVCRHELIVLGSVVAPAGSETALGASIRRLAGAVSYYPYVEGASVRVTSSASISAEALANDAGQPTDILLATGVLVVTSSVQRLGYQYVVGASHVLLPKDVDPALLGRFVSVDGQVARYPATPRVFDGKDQFSAAFFELLEAPITLVLDGSFRIEVDTTPQLLRDKVSAIVLDGKLRVPRALLPMVQVLCIARDGKIQVDDEPE